MSYRAWFEKIPTATLQGEAAQRFVKGLWGSIADSISEAMLEALYQPWLMMGEAKAEDVLRLIASERRMPRYPHESGSSHRLRLMDAWDTWEYAGTNPVILQQLAVMGLDAEIKEPRSENWNWDNRPLDWSRFWVVIKPPHPWNRGYAYGGGEHYRDPKVTYGSSMTIYEVQALRRLVRQWKAGHTRCQYIIIVFDQALWDADQPDGTWNVRSNRNRAAIYIPG